MSLELLDAIFVEKEVNPVKKATEFRKKLKRGESISLQQEFENALGDIEKRKGMAEPKEV